MDGCILTRGAFAICDCVFKLLMNINVDVVTQVCVLDRLFLFRFSLKRRRGADE